MATGWPSFFFFSFSFLYKYFIFKSIYLAVNHKIIIIRIIIIIIKRIGVERGMKESEQVEQRKGKLGGEKWCIRTQ